MDDRTLRGSASRASRRSVCIGRSDSSSRCVVELLEQRALLSAGLHAAGGEESASSSEAGRRTLMAWWASSGSSQLTLKLASDSRSRAARRPARDAYVPAGHPSASATEQISIASVAAAAIALSPMPNSDAWYSAIVNANEYIASQYHLPNVSSDLGLITDLTGTTTQAWSDAVAAVQAAHPDLLIGTYHSSRDAQYAGTFTSMPRRAVPREGLTASQILMTEPSNPDAYVVNYTQSAARKYLVRNVVQDIVDTGRPLAYVDNVSHHETGFPISWTTTTSVLREMATGLRNQGKRVIVNAAWVPGVTTTTSVDQLINTGVDGVSLEMAFHSYVRADVTRIKTAMSQYRRMLNAGLTVIFIPLGNATGGENTVENMEAEQRVQAAFGMMFRKAGDRLFTNQLFWRPTPEWTTWTTRFGPALADATVAKNTAGQIVMTRRFANYTLTLNVATKEVTYVP